MHPSYLSTKFLCAGDPSPPPRPPAPRPPNLRYHRKRNHTRRHHNRTSHRRTDPPHVSLGHPELPRGRPDHRGEPETITVSVCVCAATPRRRRRARVPVTHVPTRPLRSSILPRFRPPRGLHLGYVSSSSSTGWISPSGAPLFVDAEVSSMPPPLRRVSATHPPGASLRSRGS